MTETSSGDVQSRIPDGVNPAVPSPARMYDYLLDGTHNFPSDREAVELIRAVSPDMKDAAWANRSFHQRASRWLADRGISQFIDLGSGLPTAGTTHEIVQQVVPSARVLYVDIDPMVKLYSAELLSTAGATAVLTADLRDPAAVLESSELASVIDLSEPAGLLMTAVLQFVADEADPWAVVSRYLDALAPGSYLVLSHGTFEALPPRLVEVGEDAFASSTHNLHLRSREAISRFFNGLEIVPPIEGAAAELIHPGAWGADDPRQADSDGSRWWLAGVGRLP